MLIFASRIRRLFLSSLVLSCMLLASGCWPSLHHRSPRLMDRGQTEFGVSAGLGGTMSFGQADAQLAPGETGSSSGTLRVVKAGEELSGQASNEGPIQLSEVESLEGQIWIRGTPARGVEVGIRAFTYTLLSYGGALDFRFQLIRARSFALSLDMSGQAGGIRGSMGLPVSVYGGFDVGLTFGPTFGDRVSLYTSPHYSQHWGFPSNEEIPKAVFIPVGLDIAIGRKKRLAIRPEAMAALLLYPKLEGESSMRTEWRAGAGISISVRTPNREERREARARRQAARAERRGQAGPVASSAYESGDAESIGEEG